MKEDTLKRLVFVLIVISKVIVIGNLFLFSTYSLGGFSKDEMFRAMGILTPIFMAYITVMLNDMIGGDRHLVAEGESEAPVRRVSTFFRNLTLIVIPTYTLILVMVIRMRASGDMDFAELEKWFAGIESIFAIYIGQIMAALFKKS